MLIRSKYIYTTLIFYIVFPLNSEAEELVVETIYQGDISTSGIRVWLIGLISIILMAVFATLFLKEKNDDKNTDSLSVNDFKIIE